MTPTSAPTMLAAVLLCSLLCVDAKSMPLTLRPLIGATLNVHTTFDATDSAMQDCSTTKKAFKPKQACSGCKVCTCGQKQGRASSIRMAMNNCGEGISLPEWEYRQVLASKSYLQQLIHKEKSALNKLEAFLRENPPSAMAKDVPEDILG